MASPTPPPVPAEQKALRGWQPISTPPAHYVTVLTQHEDDLYPAVAFCVPDFLGGVVWLVETEGPEDTYDGRDGRHRALYRAPTHWMPLPAPPAQHAAEEPGR